MGKFQAEKAAIMKVEEIGQALDYVISLAENGGAAGDIAIELGEVRALVDEWLVSVKKIPKA
jgi:hypothetical protein